MDTSTQHRQQLRQQLRANRRALSEAEQTQAANTLLDILRRHPQFINAEHIAVYLPNDGELDPRPLLKLALAQGKKCFLPVINAKSSDTMAFIQYTRSTLLHTNSFGIQEPSFNAIKAIAPEQLDLVLMPLVGFDEYGGRIGMGGGFYDRCFAFKAQQPATKPRLVGIAHECQRVRKLPMMHWDIYLDDIIAV